MGFVNLDDEIASGGAVDSVNGQTGVVVLDAADVGADPAGTAASLVATLGGKYVRTTRFAIIGSGTSGTVTLPANSTVVLDDFGGTVDAVVSSVQGGKPTLTAAVTSGGAVVATTFDSSGNWVFSGSPSGYPVAILYRVQQTLSNFDSTSSDIWGNPNVYNPDDINAAGVTGNVQYNTDGVLSASPGLTYDNTGKQLTVIDGIVVDGPAFGDATQIAGSGLIALGMFWAWSVYAEIGGFYSPVPLDIETTDNSSSEPFDWQLTWEEVPGAASYLVVINYDEQNNYYGDWAFPVTTNSAIYSGSGTPGLTDTFSTPTSTLAGAVRSITLETGETGQFTVDQTGEATVATNAFIARPNGYTSINTFSTSGRLTIDDPNSNGRQLAMINSLGQQSTLVWIAPAVGDTGYYWMFGADVNASNKNNFFIWDINNNRPVFYADGTTGNIQLGSNNTGLPTMGTLTSKVQIRGETSNTTTLLGVNLLTAGAIGTQVRGAASQTANLSEWLNSSNTVLTAINSNGGFVPASMADSAAANNTLYYSTTASKLVYKNSSGVVNALY